MSLRGRSFALDAEASARNAKKAKKEARHKPLEPAGGWPDDQDVTEYDEKAWSIFGVRLADVHLMGNSNPGTWTRKKRENCTSEMVKTCAAYVMVKCFGDEMVDTSCLLYTSPSPRDS